MVRIKSSQKVFTDDEVSSLTGICMDHLRDLARAKHLGSPARGEENPTQVQRWMFSDSDLMILNILYPRCIH